jgi:glyoxylate reductase
LLQESDFVSIHVPLTDQTRKLFNSITFSKMKPGAILINTARGGVVDHNALYVALKSGQLAAAGLDVTDPEPLPMDSPLLALENLVITPHIASASRTTRELMAVMAAENLLAGLKGDKLPNFVNPQI